MASLERPLPTLPAASQPNFATIDETAEILGRLLANFPERDATEDSKRDRLRGYLVAIEGVTLPALLAAEKRIYRGEVAGLNPTWMPTPPELAILVRAIEAEERAAIVKREPPPSLERFDAAPDPNVVVKFERVQKELTNLADMQSGETRKEWLERMGERVKLLQEDQP